MTSSEFSPRQRWICDPLYCAVWRSFSRARSYNRNIIQSFASGRSRGLPARGAAMLTLWQIQVGYRSEEHTSELQSRGHLVCRLLLEKKKKIKHNQTVR